MVTPWQLLFQGVGRKRHDRTRGGRFTAVVVSMEQGASVSGCVHGSYNATERRLSIVRKKETNSIEGKRASQRGLPDDVWTNSLEEDDDW